MRLRLTIGVATVFLATFCLSAQANTTDEELTKTCADVTKVDPLPAGITPEDACTCMIRHIRSNGATDDHMALLQKLLHAAANKQPMPTIDNFALARATLDYFDEAAIDCAREFRR